jgi:hypothetical protein
MGLDRRLKALERRVPRPVVIPVAEVNDLDQYQAVLDASVMRADGRLAQGAYLDGMMGWQRAFVDDYGEAMVTLMSSPEELTVIVDLAGSNATPAADLSPLAVEVLRKARHFGAFLDEMAARQRSST